MNSNFDDGELADAQIFLDDLRSRNEGTIKGIAKALVQELVEERLKAHEYALNNLGPTAPPTAESLRQTAIINASVLFDDMKRAVQEQLKLLQFDVKVEVHQSVDGKLIFK